MRRIFTIAFFSTVAVAQGGPGPAIGLQIGESLPSLDHVVQATTGFCADCLLR